MKDARLLLAALLLASCAPLFVGCSTMPAPGHSARFWLNPSAEMTLRVEGERPQVQIDNPGPGPLRQVQWIRADGTTKFDGIPPGADLFLTLSNGDELRMLDGGGSELTIRIWNASAYSLGSAHDPVVAAKAISANDSNP